ncbi:pitrilysin family protein [Cyanobium sp. NIES-981]|uniref:M16 family metallopeptidase n=1 Tax=Cyanobium sp. NIES-981 TaxID=1851505 RepID=UPI000B355BCF|nr:pitrilysin family protein [Cyanobium sp. NIES-981]
MPLAPAATSLPGLAEPEVETLPNGARIARMPLPDAPLVCLDFWCRAGSVYEQPGESGLAHFLEHMVFKGSAGLEPGEFDRRIEAMGGSSNAATGFDDVHYHVLIPPAAAGEALDLLLELVLAPRLQDEAFQLERQVVLEELAQSEDQPEDVALQRLLRLGCGGHPYGAPILGERQALLSHTPARMGAFQRRLYGANGCVLAVAGAVGSGADALGDRLRDGALARLATAPDPSPAAPLVVRPGRHRVALPRLESARLLMLWQLPPASDLHAVMGADLLTTVLAEGRRSRLVSLLREELRLVESIDLDLHVMECGSFALLEAICDASDLEAVTAAIQQAWQVLAERPLDAQEWERACHLVGNGYRFGLESAGGVAGTVGNNLLWGRNHPLAAPLEQLRRWSPELLQARVLPLLDPALACVLEAVPA